MGGTGFSYRTFAVDYSFLQNIMSFFAPSSQIKERSLLAILIVCWRWRQHYEGNYVVHSAWSDSLEIFFFISSSCRVLVYTIRRTLCDEHWSQDVENLHFGEQSWFRRDTWIWNNELPSCSVIQSSSRSFLFSCNFRTFFVDSVDSYSFVVFKRDILSRY